MVMLAFLGYRAFSWVVVRQLPIAPSLRQVSSDSGDDGKNGKPLLGRFKGVTPDFDFESVKQSSEENSGFKKELQTKLLRPQEKAHHQRQLSKSVPEMNPLSRGTSKFDGGRRVQRMSSTEKGNRLAPFKDTSQEGKIHQEPVGDLSKLLTSMKEPRRDLGLEKLRSVIGEQKMESGKKVLGSVIPSDEDTSPRNADLASGPNSQLKNLKDLEEKIASSRHMAPKVDAVLDRKIKGLLSELKVQSKHATASKKSIVAAVENLGKSNLRKDIALEYKAQAEDWQTSTTSSEGFGFYSGNRPELFDSAFNKSMAAISEEAQSPFLLHVGERNKVDIEQTGKTHNAFKNQISLSNQLWQYPIDNEVCKVDEQNVSFEEHVFLEYLLDGFPSKGPVRRFMELVISGLQQNPHLSVKQKKERVHWFHDYFSQFSEEDLNF